MPEQSIAGRRGIQRSKGNCSMFPENADSVGVRGWWAIKGIGTRRVIHVIARELG